MTRYMVCVFCDDCSDVHSLPLKIRLDDGPVERQSVGDAFQGKRVPAKLAKLARFVVRCPRTGKSFVQKDNDRVFLVPAEEREL